MDFFLRLHGAHARHGIPSFPMKGCSFFPVQCIFPDNPRHAGSILVSLVTPDMEMQRDA
jgi:hypothetical protein